MAPWIRTLLGLERFFQRVQGWVSALVEESLLSWVAPTDRETVTAAIYDRQETYKPGEGRYLAGLFGWEEELVRTPPFPAAGRLLVGGAGGGREAVALRRLGYAVDAFDPSPALVAAGREKGDGGTLVQASYADLVRAVRTAEGPLAAIVAQPFDGILLGWSSLSHVVSPDDRVAVLRCLRTLAPRAPVILSSMPLRGFGVSRARERCRRLFALLGAPGRPTAADCFATWAGFYQELQPEHIAALASAAGYDVVVLGTEFEPHALLAPAAL
jgi:SAM-dependent methyltransferase